MTKESRDELLERILEETARNPYKRTSKPAQRKPVQTEKKPAPVPQQTVNQQPQQQPVQSEAVKPFVQPTVTQQTAQQPVPQQNEVPQQPERTQVFETSEASGLKEDTSAQEMMSAADKIQKIKQEKAAAAKAAIMRKAEIDNSRMMQNSGSFEAQKAPTFADDSEEKVNIVMPEEGYYDEAYDESPEYENEMVAVSASSKIFCILNYAIYVIFVIVFVFSYIFNIVGVSGESMKPTLEDGEKLLALNVAYTPQRGDVVIIDNKTAAVFDENGEVTEKIALDCMITKRIIAVGGDKIDFDFEKGIVTVNGEVLDEKYISEPTTRDEGAFEYPLTIPAGYVFVLGDNRNISKDSRHSDIGLVPADEVVGKAIFKVYPFSDFGVID